MGTPVGTVRSRVARARETLIAHLAEAERAWEPAADDRSRALADAVA